MTDADPSSFPMSRTLIPKLLCVQEVAELLHCSIRHVYRLSESDQMPRPLKIGSLNRWSQSAIEDWINSGCPASEEA